MRGQKSQMKGMKAGQTIAAEREWAESDSERMLARKKQHRRQAASVVLVILMAGILGLMVYSWMKEKGIEYRAAINDPVTEYKIEAQIVDEERHGQISVRMQTYIAKLEQELATMGYKITKVTLPTGKSRELYIDVEGREGYLKVSLDRGVAATAEDAERMWQYLDIHDLHPSYVDLRVEGKGFYL